MPTQPGRFEYAQWRLDTPNLLSFEDSEDRPGLLGVEYTESCDNRWAGEIRLGPLLSGVDCGAAGGTAANSNGAALSHGLNATKYIYVIRGTKWAKIQASNLTLISDNSESALGEAATDIIYTKNGAGVEEISIGMAGTAYRVITAVSGSVTDTHSANDESKVMRKFGYGTPAGVIAGLRGNAQVVEQNDISAATEMDDSAWEERVTIAGEIVQFTGFGVINGVWVIGTSNGPYYYDNDLLESRPLIEEIANTLEGPSGAFQNCDQMGSWYAAGLLVPLEGRLRLMFSPTEGESVGPEAFDRWNRSPVQGQVTAVAGSREWLYIAVYNAPADQTWIVAGRPRELDAPGSSWHRNVFSWYVVGKMGAGQETHFLKDIGYYGGRANPTMIGGNDDDMLFWVDGRIPYFPGDANYRYVTSGTVYFTELRRFPLSEKHVVGLTVETSNCSATQTITFSMSFDDGATWTQLGAPISSNGKHRLKPPEEEDPRGRHVRFRAAFATGTSEQSPVLEDRIILHYYRTPLEIDGAVLEDEA